MMLGHLGTASQNSTSAMLTCAAKVFILENDYPAQQNSIVDPIFQLCTQARMQNAAVQLGCPGDGKCSQGKKKKKSLFCPRNSLKRASFYIPCDDSESSSPQTPFAMFWLNFNCNEGVIIASIIPFMNNVMV